MEHLTELLHRAYARLAAMGQRFVATYQDVETTRSRAESGECFVAEHEGKVVGTLTLYRPHDSSDCEWYDRKDVATFGQFGVEPDLQGQGIGAALLRAAEERALEFGARELALDTSENATHLIALYERWGYRRVGQAQWNVTNYRSVIMSKTLVSSGAAQPTG